MFWYNVISNNPSYYFKMYISEIKKKKKSTFLINTFPILYCKQRIFFDGYGQRSIVLIQVLSWTQKFCKTFPILKELTTSLIILSTKEAN